MDDYTTLEFSIEDNLARITLNRPEAANGFNAVMARELCDAARRCDLDPTVKTVLLMGNGRFFCGGGDLKEMSRYGEQSSAKLKELADIFHKTITTFAHMDATLVTAVNGIAAGAGFSLALIGDIVIASAGTTFTMAYTKVGLSPDGGATYILPRLVGMRRAQELIYTNRQLSAETALEWGLLTQVVPEEELGAVALGTARKLASGPGMAHAGVRQLLRNSFSNSLEVQLELEARSISRCAGFADGREGMLAFVEKRIPRFI